MDNASDNKSRWVIAFFAWLVHLGWVKEAHISMMMPGHTHEDIDAAFGLISDQWRFDGKVLTPSTFKVMLKVRRSVRCASSYIFFLVFV